MPSKSAQTKSPIVTNLTGGLNVREAVTEIADNEALLATNLVYYTAGALVRRGGWKLLATAVAVTNKALTGIFEATFNLAGVLTYFLVVTDGSDVWTTPLPVSSSTPTWTKRTGSVTLDSTQPYRFIMMNNNLIMYNGVVAPVYWTGSSNFQNFPNGSAASTVTPTGNTTNGSPIITGMSATTSIVAGQVISGTGIPVGSTVVSVDSTTQITISLVATANGSGVTLTIAVPLTQYVPISRCAIVWQNYLWWLGCQTKEPGGSYTYMPNRAVFSNLGDPTTYPDSNFIDIPTPNDGDYLNGAAILYGNLIALKRNSLYILQGTPPSNLILSKLNSAVGCVDPNSVLQIDNLVYFVSDRGLYSMNLFNVRQSCYKVEPRYHSAIPASTGTNPIWLQHYRTRGQIFVAVNCQSDYKTSPGTKHDRLLVHDYFNADQNGDPAVSEFIAGYSLSGLRAANTSNPTGPSVMSDYFTPGASATTLGCIASFYDTRVYVFTEATTLASGGPQDALNWMSSPTSPPTEYLTKFYAFGDPDMTKVCRWVWTTGKTFNGIALQLGLHYSNNPTTSPDSSGDVFLASPGGTVYQIGVQDNGGLDSDVATEAGASGATIVLASPNNTIYTVGVDNDGALTTTATPSASVSDLVFLTTPSAFTFLLGVANDGALTTQLFSTPDTYPITPGVRTSVPVTIGGVADVAQGKYIQLYFTGIGILSQWSLDLIMKGRRL